MATKPKPVPPRPAPRLYLATPTVADLSGVTAALPDLLTAADVAAVLLKFAPADERSMIQRAKSIVPIVQKAGAALLLDGHFELAARAGADGANISGVDDLEDALSTLKPDRILGIGGLHTRHDAMLAGEAGADYVLFGEPDAKGERPSSEAIFERLQWWAEVFEPPCVGYAATMDEAGLFAESGADFILVGDFVWQDSRGSRAALVEAGEIIQKHFDRKFGRTKVS
ncbi:MAG: thiamine phosphate synthase [Afipia sp.]|nr:thiamine phosphate synthase [Afipia sp.]